ncbi:MAG TPA: ABC transporter permease [Chthoniobacterales bacterium]|nr:ABC transporter permease [Chthoniobacterales bacterium]
MIPAYLRSLIARFLRRTQTEEDLDAELRNHIELRAAVLEGSGLTRVEAERRARLEFGSPERFKEECREAIAGNFIDVLLQDLRFSIRILRKSPGFTAVVVLTIALAIGATTAIFTVVDSTLLHPLPYPHSEQLVRVVDDLEGIGAHDVGMSEPEWQDLQHSGIFGNVSPAWYDDNNLTGGAEPARVSLLIEAPNYFELLGVKAELGRTFPASDHSPGFVGEVVISNSLWKRMFGSDPAILGKQIRLDTDLYQVVGVMPASFHDPGTSPRERNIEVWAPTSFYGAPLTDHPPRSGRNLPTAIARIKSGLTIDAAQSRVDALVASLKKEYSGDYPGQMGWRIRLLPLKESVVGNVRQTLAMLLVAVGLVLLIACANVANLLLARGSVRSHEMAIRRALGAGQARLTRQLLTESMLLGLSGGVIGLGVLMLMKDFLLKLVPESLPRLNEISINWTVLLFALSVSLLSGVIFGIAPALSARRLDLIHNLKQEGRGSTGSREQARTRRSLVITEFAMSLVLMVAAGLLLHSFWDLLNEQLGFNPQNVMSIKTRIPYPNVAENDNYATAAQQAPFFREVLRRCRQLKGVEEAAMGDLGAIPLGHDRNNQNPPIPMIIEGRQTQSNEAPLVDESIVSPEYFRLMGMTLRRGRMFNDQDKDDVEAVAVINESMAQTLWPNQDPIGKRVKLSRRATVWTTIVGIVANARTESLENANVPQIYTGLYQRGAKHLAIFLRGHLDAAAIPEEVRKLVQAVDPTLPVFSAQMLNETVSASLDQRRFSLEIVGLFALTALILAAIGIYGVLSYLVSERTHEIGIRLALGAERQNILQMLLRYGLGLAITGAAIGLACALLLSNLMAGALYGIRPTDPITFGVVIVIFIVVALLASYLPAHRATKVDPIVALRSE